MTKETYIPRAEAVAKANEFTKGGFTVHFKFTCEQCGSEVVLSEPNTIYEYGECCLCGHNTKLDKVGFMAVKRLGDNNGNVSV